MAALRTEGLIKNFRSGEPILPHRFVIFGADENHIVLADDATKPVVGVSKVPLGTDDPIKPGQTPTFITEVEDQTDVVMSDLVEVELGGTVAFGDLVISGANGVAVKITPAASGTTVNHVAGICTRGGASGDIGVIMLSRMIALTA